MSTDEGDVVLDPFIGTGTTAIAAKKLGRRFIGIDIDSKYVEITKKKLESVKPIIINGCYASIFLDRIATVRDKDWEKVKSEFTIPETPLKLEKTEVRLYREQPELFPMAGIIHDLHSKKQQGYFAKGRK